MKYKDIKRYDGLVWRVFNFTLFGVDPVDDDIVQASFNIYPQAKLIEKGLRKQNYSSITHPDTFGVVYSKFEPDNTVSEKVVLVGSRERCERKLDTLADERVDPKMVCYQSFSISTT